MSGNRLLRAALVAAAVLYPLVFVLVALQRAAYPFALEWCEGSSLLQVQRVLSGRPLYAAPSLDYVAAPYSPLYYYTSAAAARVLGGGFLPLRLVSLLGAAGSMATLAHIVWRETGNRLAALLAAALFAATFRASGAWMDLARVDSLFLLLVLLAVSVLGSSTGRTGAAVAGVLLALAFFTKQTALLPAILLTVQAAVWDRRRAAWLAAAAGIPMAAGTLLLDRLHGGWYSYYTARPHPILTFRIASFWTADLLRVVPVACLLAAAMVLVRDRGDERRASVRFLLAAAAALVVTSFASRLITGAVANALMPACAGAALVFGLGVHHALLWTRRAAPAAQARLESLVYVAALVQLALLAYDPRAQLPTRADREAGQRLLQTIAATPGRVLIPHHVYLLAMAGKPVHADYSCVFDVVSYGGGPVGQRLLEQAREALRGSHYDAVILDATFMLGDDVARGYRLERRLWETQGAFVPVAGAPLKPETLWLPIHSPALPAARSSSSVPSGKLATGR